VIDDLFTAGPRLGFTGTQLGMSEHQAREFAALVLRLQPTEFHHGDCIGADAEAHDIVRRISPATHIVVHPPINPDKRAFRVATSSRAARPGDVVLQPKEYLERNHAIVDATDLLVAAPRADEEELRRGTWTTVRYARKLGRAVFLLPRQGSVGY
jgi:hypothetical protein